MKLYFNDIFTAVNSKNFLLKLASKG